MVPQIAIQELDRRLVRAIDNCLMLLVFDQYGTIVDMQKGLREAATPFLAKKGWSGNPNDFVTWWRRTHFENSMIDALLHREHTPYREIGFRAVCYTLDRAGIAYTDDEARALVGCIERLKPFPDVPAALAKLQKKYKIAVLSNGDPDMLETARQHHGIPFDQVISVGGRDIDLEHARSGREEFAEPHRELVEGCSEHDGDVRRGPRVTDARRP